MTKTNEKIEVRINPHKAFAEEVDLANLYLKDGAMYTAAATLRRLADKIDAHSDDVNKEFGLLTKAELYELRNKAPEAVVGSSTEGGDTSYSHSVYVSGRAVYSEDHKYCVEYALGWNAKASYNPVAAGVK